MGPTRVRGADVAAIANGVRHVDANVLRELLKVSSRPGMVSLAGGMPASDLFDVEGLRAATNDAMGSSVTRALQYGGSEGTVELRREVAALMAARGVHGLDEGSSIITTGSSQGIDIIGRTLLDPGDVLAVERPTFLATLTMAQLCRARLAEVETDSNGLVPESFEELVARTPVKALYVLPTFSNPSGAVQSLERRRRVVELAVEHGVMLIEDDPYGLLWFDSPPPPTLRELAEDIAGAPELCVYLGSLSKVVAPGLRLGWLVASRAILGRVAVIKQVADAHSSSLDQEIAARYLRSGRLDANVARARAAYKARAQALGDALRQELPPATFDPVQARGGMFLWGRLEGMRAAELASAALEQQVAVVPGDPFFATPSDEQYLRLSYSTLDDTTAIEGARRLGVAVQQLVAAA